MRIRFYGSKFFFLKAWVRIQGSQKNFLNFYSVLLVFASIHITLTKFKIRWSVLLQKCSVFSSNSKVNLKNYRAIFQCYTYKIFNVAKRLEKHSLRPSTRLQCLNWRNLWILLFDTFIYKLCTIVCKLIQIVAKVPIRKV